MDIWEDTPLPRAPTAVMANHYDIPSTSRTPLPSMPTTDMVNEYGVASTSDSSMSPVIARRDPTRLNRQRELKRDIISRKENAI